MKNKIYTVIAIDLIFLIFVFFSGTVVSSPLGSILYYLAFIIPIVSGFLLIKKYDEELTDKEVREKPLGIAISKKDLSLTAPIIFPAISSIALISILTSAVMKSFGFSSETELDGGFLQSLLLHALFPAVAEEILFRFIPLRLLGENKKTAVVLSSLLFSFAHASLLQIPYAMAAGIIFAAIDIITGSLLPSLIIHFLNNLVSLMIIYNIGSLTVFIVLGILTAASIYVIILKRSSYSGIRDIFNEKSEILYPPVLTFLFVAFAISVINLIL